MEPWFSVRLFQLLKAKMHFLRAKSESRAFDNVSKRAFSKKLCFEMQRIEPKCTDRFEELLQMQKWF